MKIRNGFVSNSSSSSFILIADTEIPSAYDILESLLTRKIVKNSFGDRFYKYSSKVKEYFDGDIQWIPAEEKDRKEDRKYPVSIFVDFPAELDYSRGNIRIVRTLEEKIQYIYAIYCYSLSYKVKESDEYFRKALAAAEKIVKIGKNHGYAIHMGIIPLHANRSYYDREKLDYYVGVSTECEYTGDVYDMFENEDTSELEKFLFNPKSFAALGGDEYDETYVLQRKEKRKIKKDPYPYHRIADYPDHKAGDVMCYEDDKPVLWGYDYEWGEEEKAD